jgi:5-methyltetrahydropteroyltriglutamate--homocysteine methyltransferase
MGTLQNNTKRNTRMILSTDIGSLPFENGLSKDPQQKIVQSFLDKLNAGIDVPNFPQFRDMSQMFLQLIKGLEKIEGGYVETDVLYIKDGEGRIPEMEALRANANQIAEKIGESVKIRFCISGPYTLSRFFVYKNARTLTRLGNVLAEIIEQNIFRYKNCAVVMVSVDEPVFGTVDDPMLDIGSEGREALLKAWENMFHKAATKNVETYLHLHSSSDELFWNAEKLKIIDFPVNDPIYQAKTVKRKFESMDKFLKASICITEFDALIKRKLEATHHKSVSSQEIGETWKQMATGTISPETFLEEVDVMKKRLQKIVSLFGVERVPYAGPECGLKGFPTYKCAIECLKRVASAINRF